jgi:thiaminase/transcriptional activator TenA
VISESQRLRASGADGWAAAVAHPMVAEIGAGSLPHATFRFYFEQNLGYLREYARAIAFAATATTDRGALSTLARFLGQIADVEIPANEAFLERLGGSPARLKGLKGSVTMQPVTYAYTRHLLDATSRGSLAVGLAALLPCQWSYGEIGRRLARSLPADPVYRDWIALFAGDGYDELVAASTDLLDASCTRRDRVATSDAFDRSTRYEIAFWHMAYTRGGEKGVLLSSEPP